jgi:uncharacterized protein with PIN domain
MPISGSGAYAVDTSVAVASLDESHEAHVACRAAAVDHRPALAGHAAFETFAVLTRLPGPSRVSAGLARELLDAAYPDRCWLRPDEQNQLLALFPSIGVVGGMVYDALVGAAARQAERVLLSRDRRALRTYEALGVNVEFVG